MVDKKSFKDQVEGEKPLVDRLRAYAGAYSGKCYQFCVRLRMLDHIRAVLEMLISDSNQNKFGRERFYDKTYQKLGYGFCYNKEEDQYYITFIFTTVDYVADLQRIPRYISQLVEDGRLIEINNFDSAFIKKELAEK